VPGVAGLRVYPLGPPRKAELIADEDPEGDEAFPRSEQPFATLFAAARMEPGAGANAAPFRDGLAIRLEVAFVHPETAGFLSRRYGPFEAPAATGLSEAVDGRAVPDAAPFRRIDGEWLLAAEDFALKLNKGVNNTSLVLAFELPKSRKVLLFVGDAQRGNWLSWDAGTFEDGGRRIDARDLLARTVLYKVGHHASHNATLAGPADSKWPSLGWMAHGKAADEFTAMITAVPKWAFAKKPHPWQHPQRAIKLALARRCQGRVLQTDTDEVEKPAGVSDKAWSAFTKRLKVTNLFFEYQVPDA
jgi:hypothetical protein